MTRRFLRIKCILMTVPHARVLQRHWAIIAKSVTANPKGISWPQKFNKIYIQQDAIAKHEDFDAWYEDGDVFLRFTSNRAGAARRTACRSWGRMGGQVGLIKPDNNVLNYYIRYERWEYILHTIVIEHHYYIEGMVWDLYGCAHKPRAPSPRKHLTSFDRKGGTSSS